MITVRRDTCGDGAAKDLRGVELIASGVRTGNYDPAHGVKCAMPKAALAQLIKARILVQHRGKNCGSPVVFYGAICGSRSKALAITRCTLAVTRLTVFRLTDSRQKRIPGHLDVVERRPCHHRELLLGG